ncbi:MAG TPA: dienelactone hydrolase family protein, partial [Anaerolineae bacterium]|nr:dienelactone hydrolase family protein [Anaerolineae bacterium]
MNETRPQQDDSLKQYLIEEFLEDYQEGRMTRRDALKRLVGLTASVALSNMLLAACAPAAQPPAATGIPSAVPTLAPSGSSGIPSPVATVAPAATAAATTAAGATATAPATAMPDATLTTQATATVSAGNADIHVSESDPAIKVSTVQFPSQGATIMGYLARPSAEGTYAAILVCHENRGLTEHIKDVTRRLAKAGYVALAVDLLSRQGGSDKQSESAIPGLLGNMDPAQMVGDFAAGVAYLKTQPFIAQGQFGMTGFCFGGGITWRAATQIPELRAAVPYYGPNPPLEDVPKIQAAVLAHYGALDQRIDAGIPAIEQAMKQNNKIFEYHVYPGANHAFNNDTG